MKILKNPELSICSLITVLTLFIPTTLFSQQATRKEIVIKGFVSDSILKTNPRMAIVLNNDFLTTVDSNLYTIIPVKMMGNTFEVKFKPNYEFTYYQFAFAQSLSTSQPTLALPGDTIFYRVESDKLFKLTSNNHLADCQVELNELYFGNHIKFDETVQQQMDSLISNSQNILSKYKRFMSDKTLEILRVNQMSLIQNSAVVLCTPIAHQLVSRASNRNYAATFIRSVYESRELIKDDNIIRNSLHYARFIVDLEKAYFGLDIENTDFKRHRFDKTFNALDTRYQGLLREKLLAILFLRNFNESDHAIEFLNQSIPTVKDPLYKRILMALKTSKTKGNPAFPFELEGWDGKKYSLKDFKNKVLVFDFWFNGCGGCAQLKRQLEPLKKKLQSNRDIVFVSISVDRTRKLWTEGVKSGNYTSSNDVKLWLNAPLKRHPLLEFYRYSAFPQMLLVDRNGNIISSSPERPYDDASLLRFEQIIKSYL